MGTNKTNFPTTIADVHLETVLFDFCHFCNWTWYIYVVTIQKNKILVKTKKEANSVNKNCPMLIGFQIFQCHFKIIMVPKRHYVQLLNQNRKHLISTMGKFYNITQHYILQPNFPFFSAVQIQIIKIYYHIKYYLGLVLSFS